MTNDPLLDAIVRAPDDDAPRLVWADREGGERGELVVLQCAIANDFSISRERRRVMILRERELLQKNAAEWSNAAGLGKTTFERGFPHALRVSPAHLCGKEREVHERAPTLREIWFDDLGEGDWSGPSAPEVWAITAAQIAETLTTFAKLAPSSADAAFIDRIRVYPLIRVEGEWDGDPGTEQSFGEEMLSLLLDADPRFASRMRSLLLHSARLSLNAIRSLRDFPRLERLSLNSHALTGKDCVELLEQNKALTHLALWNGDIKLVGDHLRTFLASPRVAKLVDLELYGNVLTDSDLAELAKCPNLGALKRLALQNCRFTPSAIESFASSPFVSQLTHLTVVSCVDTDEKLAALSTAKFAPTLRHLDLGYTSITKRSQPLFSSFSSLESLRIDNRGVLDKKLLANEIAIVIA